MSNIWVIVYCNEGMSQGDVYMHRLLRGDDIIDAKIYANEVAESLDLEIDDSDGYIPNCSGDMRVEFWFERPKLETREDHSMPSIKHYPAHIWTGQSFYFRL